jgi:acyl dehydratase
MIDVTRAVGAELAPVEGAWDEDDVILYHLGVGAADLAYVYERGLKVLPTFAVLEGMRVLATGLSTVAGLAYDPAKVLHGGQRVTIARPLPTRAEVVTSGHVVAIHDKGSAALTVVDTITRTRDGDELARNRFSLFMRDAGGFGGDRGPASERVVLDGAPDLDVECDVPANQALIYRLSGDKNPLHADPEAAAKLGFDRPILHGLSTFGLVCRAAVDGLLDGDVTRVAEFGGRFSGVVFPGDAVRVRAWRRDGRVAVEASVDGREGSVLTGCELTLRG